MTTILFQHCTGSTERIDQFLIIHNNHFTFMLYVLLCYLFKYNDLVTCFIMINSVNYLW
jgi:hypothetical protein